MDFEKLYSILPGFIKYNNTILNFFLNIAKKIQNSSYVKSQRMSLHEFEASPTLKNTQILTLEILRFIDNVCNKYDIEYWITGGTLLGAVRHGGFIPWDDDVDISFLRKDYERFIEIIPNEIAKYGYFKQMAGLTLLRDNHENFFKDFTSVYDFEGNKNSLIYKKSLFLQIGWMKPFVKIDCFPLDYVLDEKLNYFNKMYVSTKYRFNNEIKLGKKNFKDEFFIRSNELGFTRNETNYVNDSLDTIDLYPASLRKIREIFPLSLIQFENYSFKCPKNNDYYLKLLFGNSYMEFPEVIESHNSISLIETQFNSKQEMNEKFKNDINYLREINNNFE